MKLARLLGILPLSFCVLAAQSLPEDPVLKAQASRQASGAAGDLPPVPRAVLEPPPLPPPEVHVRDTPGGKRGKRGKAARNAKTAGKATKGKGGKSAVKGKAAPKTGKTAPKAKKRKR